MDPNFTVLLIVVGIVSVIAVVAAVFQSSRVREHGLLGALRRVFSGGAGRNPYSS
ncbi:hypothetical protein [Phenylobacterium sp.]|uniref:hypothetical protein n=1 Tax=Phenylobacterium sp. TaxID=1871053 RepID=UPI00374D7E15